MKQRENGSVHIIITLILAVALIGVLGYMVWVNVLQKPSTTVNSDQNKVASTSANSDNKTAEFNSAFTDRVKFSYPSDWSIKRSVSGSIPFDENGSPTIETIKVTSPSGKITVTYSLGTGGGFGGTCDSESSPTSKIVSVDKTPVSKFSKRTFIEYTLKTDKGYELGSRIINTSSAADVEVGASHCTVANGILDMTQNSILNALVTLNNYSSDADGTYNQVNDGTTVESIYSQIEYKQAKAIMLSTEEINES